MLKLSIESNIEETINGLAAGRKNTIAELIQAVEWGALKIKERAKGSYFVTGGGKNSPAIPGKLTSRTGRLRGSIIATRAEVVADGDTFKEINAYTGTNKKYAAAHELGFDGTVSIPTHQRKIKEAFGKTLPKPIEITVSGYERKMKLPKRPFLQPARDDESQPILNKIHAALARAYKGA
jgi:phage gpG-like protein